ncbi:ferredoxin [Bradyrhizobium arachidis]|uniref:(2Fe-2S) ferredoxin domain-containing protein n=1 Tax=Bradyrhizobium arachidis TaxID=858423 RepID=UPI002163B9DC|nr:(2Fe-2S) ferredoxin domain-containing protein [Bradyrhizobium arachidis]UVO30622.1 (2Fe-2S) ferredoxin domain-containing protein [Bradyrhizobium arachidis]
MDNNMNEFELPQLYRHHVFSCHTQRPPDHPHGSCGTAGGGPLWERLGKAIEARGLTDVGFTAAGCLGFCSSGPLMVVYPDGVWYRPRSSEDIDEIVDSHLKNGRRVDRLVIVLTRS